MYFIFFTVPTALPTMYILLVQELGRKYDDTPTIIHACTVYRFWFAYILCLYAGHSPKQILLSLLLVLLKKRL
jgi:hypothetical protein